MGCAFRLRRIRETASRFRAIFRVALSATHPIRKMRPTIRAKTGSRFPKHSMQRWHKECPQLPPGHLRTSITVEIVSPGPSRATIEARPERAADRAPAHGRTSLPPRGPVGCCRRGTRRPRRLIGKCRAGAAAGNVSAEGEAIRSNDYRKDTTVKAPSTRPAAVLGLDVGKSSHWACLIDRDGEVLASAPVRNREAELDALFASAPAGTLVVVDQYIIHCVQGHGHLLHPSRAGSPK